MSQAEAIRREPYMKYYSKEEISKMCLKYADYVAQKKSDTPEAQSLLREIPLLPKSANIQKKMFGVNSLIDSGVNLYEAVQEYGYDWLKR